MENEKRLIFVDAVLTGIATFKECYEGAGLKPWILEQIHTALQMVERFVKEYPTVDAVEVVRCKDCKWYRMAPIDNVPYCSHESGYCGEYMGGLFYCACGERKDNG